MTLNQKTIGIALGVAGFLFLALLAGMLFSHTTAPRPLDVPIAFDASGETAPERHTAPPTTGDSPMAHLQVAESSLESAQTGMARASAAGKDGYVEKSRADIASALVYLNDCIEFINAHPEAAARPASPQAAFLPPAPGGRANAAPNLRTALADIKTTQAQVQLASGGDMGGAREKLYAELQHAAEDLAAGVTASLSIPPANRARGITTPNLNPASRPPLPTLTNLPADMIAPRSSLAVSVTPAKPLFQPGELLGFDVTFRNTSTKDFRLPNNGGLHGEWLLHIEDAQHNKTWTAGVAVRAPGATTARPKLIPAGQSLSVTPGFPTPVVTFVEGTLDYDAFQKAAALVPSSVARTGVNPGDPRCPLPEGKYAVTLVIRFPVNILADGNTTPIWYYDAIDSKPVDLEIGALPAASLGSVSGTVLRSNGTPAADTAIAYQRPSRYTSPPIPDSGFANAVAINVAAPQNSATLVNAGIYSGGVPAGTTNDKGEFAIKGLAPGTYIITAAFRTASTAGGRGTLEEGSQQPVEVKAGTDTKITAPVQLQDMSRARGGVGG